MKDQDLMIMLAKVIPIELLLSELESDLREAKVAIILAKTEEEKEKAIHKLTFSCMMMVTRSLHGSVPEILQDMEKLERVHNLINKPGMS